MSLAGCTTTSSLNLPATGQADKAARVKAEAPRCPTPTDGKKKATIAKYLDKAVPDPGLDTLSTEWERLNDGSQICRGIKK